MSNHPTAKDIHIGAVIIAGDGHHCLDLGQECTVQEDKDGDHYVKCRAGRHYVRTDYALEGFTKKEKQA